MTERLTGVITERENGLADAGEIVMHTDGTLYEVGESAGPIEVRAGQMSQEVHLQRVGHARENPELTCTDPKRHHAECTCAVSDCAVAR